MGTRITRLRILSYRGIESLDTEIPPAGVIVSGRNGAAKTSVLRAIKAALEGQDISPNAIRLGADRAEILIDIDDLSVQRTITPDGSKISVERSFGGKVQSPAKFLKELLGASPLDPLDLLAGDTAEQRRDRRAKVLKCVPTTVTIEQIEAWTGERPKGAVDPTANGLAIVDQLRTAYYDRRKVANAQADEARRKADDVAKGADGLPEKPQDIPSASEAHAAKLRASKAVDELLALARAAREADERTASTRARVDDLRARAKSEIEGITEPTQEETDAALRSEKGWGQRIAALKAELADIQKEIAEAERSQSTAALCLKQIEARKEQVAAARRRSADMERQASDLEAAISAASVHAPSETDIDRAREAFDRAREAHETACYHEQNDCVRQDAFAAEQAARALEAEAARLDKVVRTLTNDAPAELLASDDAIKGLRIEGDQLYLDGVDFDGLCESEKLRFAVRISKRLSRSHILFADGLERIDPVRLEEFVRLCTSDGWQLFGTLVSAGERTINAIELDDVQS